MKSARLRLDTGRRRAIVDITGEVATFVRGETDGLLNISVPHATAGLVLMCVGILGLCIGLFLLLRGRSPDVPPAV